MSEPSDIFSVMTVHALDVSIAQTQYTFLRTNAVSDAWGSFWVRAISFQESTGCHSSATRAA